MGNLDYFVHSANVLFLISYSVRDILWLRCLTVLACFALIPFNYFQPEPLIAPIIWLSVFICLNIVQVGILVYERRPIHFTEDENRLFQMVFRTLTPVEFLKLLKVAHWMEAKPSEQLTREGDALENLMVIFSGRVSVEADGKLVAEISDGQFIGEMSFLTGEHASATVIALEATRYVAWLKKDLRLFIERNPDVRPSLQALIGTDLVKKLKQGSMDR